MADERERKAGEFDRVVYPKYCHREFWNVFSVIERKVLEAAARRALARGPKTGLVILSVEDLVHGVHAVLPDAAREFDQCLGEIKKTHVRRAS